MRVVKVLLLDDAPWYLPDLTEQGITLDVIQESLWGTKDAYFPTDEVCVAVRRLTTEAKVDLVVVGNNLGAGVIKAGAIADGMKGKTIVVWNTYRPGKEAPYSALGIVHFGSRPDLVHLVPAVIGIGN